MSNLLYTLKTDRGTFGYFRKDYDPGFWVNLRTNLYTHLELGVELTKEAKAKGAADSIFVTPEKPKPVAIGRAPSKRSIGVKLFG